MRKMQFSLKNVDLYFYLNETFSKIATFSSTSEQTTKVTIEFVAKEYLLYTLSKRIHIETQNLHIIYFQAAIFQLLDDIFEQIMPIF